ncbi:MAG TPA: translesion error-prone DNA polymerase V autoproteolytic subunit [Chitinophagaceae bacterium]|nr:translesion error-prone DNA polymerase V autoproteolytic subunit [Chitinophagaceae bacterium]
MLIRTLSPAVDPLLLPLSGAAVQAGFPSPALDYSEEEIDFNAFLVEHPLATFVVRVSGDSMVDACIPDGAWLIVDRSLKPRDQAIIVAVLNGEFTVKRFRKTREGIRLCPANKKYAAIDITEAMDFQVWGVVTRIIVEADKI